MAAPAALEGFFRPGHAIHSRSRQWGIPEDCTIQGQLLLPFGNQMWQWKIPYKWGFQWENPGTIWWIFQQLTFYSWRVHVTYILFFKKIICIHRPYRCHVALNSMCRADLFARLQELVESSGITKVEKPWDRQRMGGLGETGRCHWPWRPWQHPDHRRPILWVEAFGAFWADFWAQNWRHHIIGSLYIYIHPPVFLMVCPLVCFSNNMFFCL